MVELSQAIFLMTDPCVGWPLQDSYFYNYIVQKIGIHLVLFSGMQLEWEGEDCIEDTSGNARRKETTRKIKT
jgi:hypothetical protein